MNRHLDDHEKRVSSWSDLRSRLGGGGLAMLVLLALSPSCAEELPRVDYVKPVKTVEFGGSGVSETRSFPGTVQAAQQARLSFRVAGPLVELPIFEGQQVGRGRVLARIDPRDFQTAVRNVEARVADLKAQYEAMQSARPEDIRALEASLTGAQARLLEAEATLRRYRRLYENDNVAKAEYDQRRAARDVAQADVRTAEETLKVAREGARPEDLQAMEARIRAMEADQARARDQLEDTTLRAPYDGIVAEVYTENFEFIQAQQEVLSLQNITVIEVVTQIPEVLFAQVRREGAEPDMIASFEGLPGKEFPARLTEIAGQADPVTRTYAVTLQVAQPEEGNILAGMTAEISPRKPLREQTASTLPVSALVPGNQGGYFVWVVDENSMETRQVSVEVGDLTRDRAIVLAGLDVGDRVITAGASAISAGQQVRLITDGGSEDESGRILDRQKNHHLRSDRAGLHRRPCCLPGIGAAGRPRIYDQGSGGDDPLSGGFSLGGLRRGHRGDRRSGAGDGPALGSPLSLQAWAVDHLRRDAEKVRQAHAASGVGRVAPQGWRRAGKATPGSRSLDRQRRLR